MPYFVDIPKLEQQYIKAILGQIEDENRTIKY